MTLLKTRIEKKLKEFQDEYNLLSLKFFGKGSSFLDEELQRGAYLEQCIDDLKNILEGINSGKILTCVHINLLKRVNIFYTDERRYNKQKCQA
jgi:hypothetical protein